MMKSLVIAALMAAPLLLSCSKPESGKEEPAEAGEVVLSMADPSATAETKALYSNLWAIRDKGWMFGHHDDLMYGRKWYGEQGASDTKAVCGDYPAVYALDLASFMDERAETELDDNALRIRCMKDAYNRGMVIIACMHLNNPLTGGDAWDNSNRQVVAEILKEGSAVRTKFNSWLDRLARLAVNLKGADGKNIPIIIRTLFFIMTASFHNGAF